MTALSLTRRFGPVLASACIAMGLGGAAALAQRHDAIALVNESPSLPRGLYLRGPDGPLRRGDVTAVPQPDRARPYLASLGMPAEVLLIKRVAAIGGDRVCAEPGVVLAMGRRVEVQVRDRRGASLPVWRDCRRLAQGEVFLLGDTASSFDSRYFGPVQRSETTGRYREVLTW